MLPFKRNFRRIERGPLAIDTVASSSTDPLIVWENDARHYASTCGPRPRVNPGWENLGGYTGAYSLPSDLYTDADTRIWKDGDIDMDYNSAGVWVNTGLPRLVNESTSDFYAGIQNYQYLYNSFNSDPNTLLADEWSATDPEPANYPFDYLYLDSAKLGEPELTGEEYILDTYTSPRDEGERYLGVGSFSWFDKLKEHAPAKYSDYLSGSYPPTPLDSAALDRRTTPSKLPYQVNAGDGEYRESIHAVIRPYTTDSSYTVNYNEYLAQATLGGGDSIHQVRGKWLHYAHFRNWQANNSMPEFQWTCDAYGNSDGPGTNNRTWYLSSEDTQWEMIITSLKVTRNYDAGLALYFVVYPAAPGRNFDYGVSGNQHRFVCIDCIEIDEVYAGAMSFDDPEWIMTEEWAQEFLELWIAAKGFDDDIKRYDVDQADAALYVGSTSSWIWLDEIYEWHKLKRFDTIALNDDFYLIDECTREGGYHKIGLYSDVYKFNRGEGNASPAVSGTYSTTIDGPDTLVISGVDAYGRTVDWASVQDSSIWTSIDGETWQEEDALLWVPYDSVNETQYLAGVTSPPSSVTYVSLTDPAVRTPLTADYTSGSLRVTPKATLESSLRELRAGEWEFVSPTRFRFSEESLDATQPLPGIGSLWLSRDNGATYEEFTVQGRSIQGGVITVDWATGSPVWTEAPTNLRIAALDPAVTTPSKEVSLSYLYFSTTSSASTDMTDMVTTEEIQKEDVIEVNGTSYAVETVETTPDYIKVGTTADLTSITGGFPGNATVDFDYFKQPYGYSSLNGKQITDYLANEPWWKAVENAEPYYWLNPVTNVREPDPYGRKALKFRFEYNGYSGEFVLPVAAMNAHAVRRNENFSNDKDSLYEFRSPSTSVTEFGALYPFNSMPNSPNIPSMVFFTGFNQHPGLQEPGIRRYRLPPVYELVTPSERANFGHEDMSFPKAIWPMHSDNVGLQGTHQRQFPFGPMLQYDEAAPEVPELEDMMVRRHHPGGMPNSTEWWDLNIGLEGAANCTPEQWKLSKVWWLTLSDTSEMDPATIYDYYDPDLQTQDVQVATYTTEEARIVKNPDYYPYNIGGGSGGGGGGSERPELGLIYPRRFG